MTTHLEPLSEIYDKLNQVNGKTFFCKINGKHCN